MTGKSRQRSKTKWRRNGEEKVPYNVLIQSLSENAKNRKPSQGVTSG